MQGCREGRKKKEMEGKQARREEDRREKRKTENPLVIHQHQPPGKELHNRQKPPSDPKEPINPKDVINARPCPVRIDTEGRNLQGKVEFKDGIPGSTKT